MKELYRSRAYDPERVVRRYVAFVGPERFRITELTHALLMIRQIETDGQELPVRVRLAAERSGGLVLWD